MKWIVLTIMIAMIALLSDGIFNITGSWGFAEAAFAITFLIGGGIWLGVTT